MSTGMALTVGFRPVAQARPRQQQPDEPGRVHPHVPLPAVMCAHVQRV